MRPVPIPDECVPEGAERRVLAAPDGDLTDDNIRPAEALLIFNDSGVPFYQFRIVLEGDDLQKLQAGQPIWLTLVGAVPPFALEVSE